MTQWRDCDGKSGIYAGNLALILILSWTKLRFCPTQYATPKAHFRIASAPEHLHAGTCVKRRHFSRFRVGLTTADIKKTPYKPILAFSTHRTKQNYANSISNYQFAVKSQRDRQIAFFAFLPQDRRKSDKFPIFERNSDGSL